ncbi:MAG: sulfatase [Alphaproteobacteria bacterium]
MSVGTERSGAGKEADTGTSAVRAALLLVALGAIAWALARTSAGCHAQPPSPGAARKPNVLLVSLDTTRADHTSAYGYRRPTTPRLDGLLPSSVRFDEAYAPMATTMPSHSTMFTSLHPRSHGVLKNGQVLAEGSATLAGALAEAGWRTSGVVSSYVLHRKFGPAQGFADWDDRFGEKPCKMLGKNWEGRDLDESFCRRGSETRDHGVEWLEQNGYLSADRRPAEPFFLFVHFFDAHNPYVPPPEDAALFPVEGESPTDLDREIAAYDGEIHYADARMGELLDRLSAAGVLDDTLLVVVGDHGEGLMQHDWMNHGMMIYDEAVHVPFIVRWPGHVRGGRSIAAPVSLVDLAPTVLDLVSVEGALPRRQGRSLAAALAGTADLDPLAPVFLQRRLYEVESLRGVKVRGAKLAVRVGNLKYLEAPAEGTRELYDLDKDPGELENLATTRVPDVRRLQAVLTEWLARTPQANSGGVSAADAERLRALGYVQ